MPIVPDTAVLSAVHMAAGLNSLQQQDLRPAELYASSTGRLVFLWLLII
jgi:hypothetical protein